MAPRAIKVPPFDPVVFGGAGDLAGRALYPAPPHREMSGGSGEPRRVIGVSRRPLDRARQPPRPGVAGAWGPAAAEAPIARDGHTCNEDPE